MQVILLRFIIEDTSSMFLFHRYLSGIDGFADAAELKEKQREVVRA